MALRLGPMKLGGGGVRQLYSGAPVDLEERDPEFIRRMLPGLWLTASTWFRPEVSGFENVPDEPVLFVGNHSGGSMIPDTYVFLLAYNTFFTVDGRPLYSLGHEIVTAMPGLVTGWLIAARHLEAGLEEIRHLLEYGDAVSAQ